jgi:hypothetical protein
MPVTRTGLAGSKPPRSRVTLTRKCYVYVCVGCGLLDETERSDQLTCSPACRVRAHRNGALKVLRTHAKSLDVDPALVLRCCAVQLLRPDLADDIRAGRLKVDDAQPDVHRAFIARAFAAARLARGRP